MTEEEHTTDHPILPKSSLQTWQAKNPERSREIKRASALKHREKTRERQKIFRKEHPEINAAYQARYRAAHPERVQEARRTSAAKLESKSKKLAYQESHKAEKSAYDKVYREANRYKRHASHAKRKAIKRNVAINDFTAAQWRELQAAVDHRCAYCKKRFKNRLTMDHLTPLAKGGNHTYSNIIPACSSCNSKKGTRPPLTPVQPLLLTLAPSRKTG